MIDEIPDGPNVAVAFDVVSKDKIVAQDRLRCIWIREKRIASECNSGTIDRDEESHLVLGVTRRVRYLEIVFLPFEPLTMPERA
jgi:hypothetical protein